MMPLNKGSVSPLFNALMSLGVS